MKTVFVIATLLLANLTQADNPAPRRFQAWYEVQFLTGMIDHHHMAIMMAELCEGRTVHAELAQLCEQIITAQTEEIELMQGWLQDWYGLQHEPVMGSRDADQVEELAALTGEEFEMEFLQMMIGHHTQAVRESATCQRRAYHAPLRELCAMMAEDQLEEIATIKDWLCEWYDVCHRLDRHRKHHRSSHRHGHRWKQLGE